MNATAVQAVAAVVAAMAVQAAKEAAPLLAQADRNKSGKENSMFNLNKNFISALVEKITPVKLVPAGVTVAYECNSCSSSCSGGCTLGCKGCQGSCSATCADGGYKS